MDLHWTGPARTTDGLDLAPQTTVEICRDDAAARSPANSLQPPCTVALRVAGHAGPASTADYLPAALTDARAAGMLLAYRVRVLNSSGRAAAPLAAAFAPAGAAPPSVAGFRAVQKKDGVLLQWDESRSASNAAVEVLRTDLTPRPVPAKTPGGPPVAPKAQSPLAGRRKADSSAGVLLRPDAASPGTPALQGMIDQTALQDGTYSYRARRVVTVLAEGKSLPVLSEPSPSITVTMSDTFPPAVPQGLASIPGSTAKGATIDLSWQPNTEVDLAGYLVERAGPVGAGSRWTRLTASAIAGSAFRDTSVLPGHRYAYRVLAVDRRGNESAPSAPIEDTPEGR